MIHLGRWQDTIPGSYDPATSVVITDPPFGIGRLAYDDQVSWADHVREVLEKLPASRHVIRGPSPLICRMDVPPPRRMVIETSNGWKNAATRPGVMMHRWHGWLLYGSLRMGKGRRPPVDVFTVDSYDDVMGGSGGNVHDAKTPWAACYRVVSMFAETGATVIDPYMGTGSIGVASRMLGHGYIGSETDIRWHNQAIARMDAGIQTEAFR